MQDYYKINLEGFRKIIKKYDKVFKQIAQT